MGETKQREQVPEPVAALRADGAALRPQLQPPPFQTGPSTQVNPYQTNDQARAAAGIAVGTGKALGPAVAPIATPSELRGIESRARDKLGHIPEALVVLAKMAADRQKMEAAAQEGRVDREAMNRARDQAGGLIAIMNGVAKAEAAESQGVPHATAMKGNMFKSLGLLAQEVPEALTRVAAAAKVTSDYLDHPQVYQAAGNEPALTHLLTVQTRLTDPAVQMSPEDIMRDVDTVGRNFQTAVVNAYGQLGMAVLAMMSQVQMLNAYQSVRESLRSETEKLEEKLKGLLKLLGDGEKTDAEKERAVKEAEDSTQKFVLKGLEDLLKDQPELAAAVGKAAKFLGTARAGLLLQAGLMYVRYREAFEEKKELLGKLVESAKKLADEKLSFEDARREIAGKLQEVSKEAHKVYTGIMQVRMQMSANLRTAMGELAKMMEREASKPLRDAMNNVMQSMQEMLRKLQSPKTAKEVTEKAFRNTLETFGYLKAVMASLSKMPTAKPEEKKDRENAAQLLAHAVKASLKDARSEMSRMLQYIAGDHIRSADAAYRATLVGLGNALAEGKKTLEEAKKEIVGRIKQEGAAMLAGLAKLGDNRLAGLVKGLLPSKEKPEQETMESIFKARQALEVGSFALKEVAAEKAEYVKKTALGLLRGALERLGKGETANSSQLFATAQEYIRNPEARSEVDRQLFSTRKAVQGYEKDAAAFRSTIDAGPAFREALRKLHETAKDIRTRLEDGELVPNEEFTKLEALWKYAERMVKEVTQGAEGQARKAAGEIFARGFEALSSGDSLGASVQGLLASEYMKGNAAYKRQLEGLSSLLAKGEMKADEAIRQVASHLAGELAKVPAIKRFVDSGISASLNMLMQRGKAQDATLADAENLRSALELAREYKSSIGNTRDKDGATKVFARAFAGIARGLPPEYVESQKRLARWHISPVVAEAKDADAKRAQIERMSSALEDTSLLAAVHSLVTREPPLGETAIVQGFAALFGSTEAGAKAADAAYKRYLALGPNSEARLKALEGMAAFPNTFVKLSIAEEEIAKKRDAAAKGSGRKGYEASVFGKGMAFIEKALAALSTGEKPSEEALKAAESARVLLLGTQEEIAALFAPSKEKLPETLAQFAGTSGLSGLLAGKSGTPRLDVLYLANIAINMIGEGNMPAFASAVMAMNASAASKSVEDRGKIWESMDGMVSPEEAKKYTPDQAFWVCRLQLDRAQALAKAKDEGTRKNVNAYYDLALVMYERRDQAGAERARMLAANYALASQQDQADPAVKATIELAHRVLGDFRKGEPGKRRIMDITRPEADKQRYVPKALDGVAGRAVAAGTTFESQLKAEEATEKDKGTAMGDVLALPAERRLEGLSIRMGGLEAGVKGQEFNRSGTEVIPTAGSARKRTEAVYVGENKHHTKKADTAEKAGDATEAERQREEAAAATVPYMEGQIQRARGLHAKGVELVRQSEALRLQALSESPEQAAETNKKADAANRRGLQLMQLAEAAQKALRTHHESVMKVRHGNRDMGRWRLRDAADAFLTAGEELAASGAENPDGRQSVLIATAGKWMAKGTQDVEEQKRLWQQALAKLEQIKKKEATAKENQERYGTITLSRDVTREGKKVGSKGDAAVETKQRLQDLANARAAAVNLRFRTADHWIAKADAGNLLDQRRATTEINYNELLGGATPQERESGVFRTEERAPTKGGKPVKVGFDYNDLMGRLCVARTALNAGNVGQANREMKGYDHDLSVAYQSQRKLNDSHRDGTSLAELDRLIADAEKWGDMSAAEREDLARRLAVLASKGIITSLGEKPYREAIEDIIRKHNEENKAAGKPPNYTAADFRKSAEVAIKSYEEKKRAGTLTEKEAEDLEGFRKLRDVAQEMEKDPVSLAQRQQVADAIRSTGAPKALADAGRALQTDVGKDKLKAEAQIQDIVDNGPVTYVMGPQDTGRLLDAVLEKRGWDARYYRNILESGEPGAAARAFREFVRKNPDTAIAAIEYMRDNGMLGKDKDAAGRVAAFAITDIESGRVAMRTEAYARGHGIAMASLSLALETANAVDTQERMSGVGGGNGSWYIGMRGDAASILQFALVACNSPESIAEDLQKGKQLWLPAVNLKLRSGGGITEPSEAWLRAGQDQQVGADFLEARLGNFLNTFQKFSVGSPQSARENMEYMESGQWDKVKFTHSDADNVAGIVTRGVMSAGGLAYDKESEGYVPVAFNMEELRARQTLLYGDQKSQKGGYLELLSRFTSTGTALQSIWSYSERKDMYAALGRQADEVNTALDRITDARVSGTAMDKIDLDHTVAIVGIRRDYNIGMYDIGMEYGKKWESFGRAVSGIGKLAGAGILIASGYGSVVGVAFGVEALHDLADNARKSGGYQYMAPEAAAMGWASVALSFGGAALGEATAIANESLQITRAGAQEAITFGQEAFAAGRMTTTELSSFTTEIMAASRGSWLANSFSSQGWITQVAGTGMTASGLGMAGYGMKEAWRGYQTGESTFLEFAVSGPVGLAQAGVPVLGHSFMPTGRLIPRLWTSESLGASIFRGSMLFLTGETRGAFQAAHFSGIREQAFTEFNKLPTAQRDAVMAVERSMGRTMFPEEQLNVMRTLPLERNANGELVLRDGRAVASGQWGEAEKSRFIGNALAQVEAAPRIEALNQAYADHRAGKLDEARAQELGLRPGDLALFGKDGELAKAKTPEAAAAQISNLAVNEARQRQAEKAAAEAPAAANARSKQRAMQLAEGFRKFVAGKLDEASARAFGIDKPQLDLFQRLAQMAPADIRAGIVRQAEGEMVQKERAGTMRERAEAARTVGSRNEYSQSFSVEHVAGEGFYRKFAGARYTEEHAAAAADIGAVAQSLYSRSKKQPITREAVAAELARLGEAGVKVPESKVDATLALLGDSRFLKAVDAGDRVASLQRALDKAYDMPGLNVSKDAVSARIAPEAGSYIQNRDYPQSGLVRRSAEQAGKASSLRGKARESTARAEALPQGSAEKASLEALARRQTLQADAHEANASALTAELNRRFGVLEKDAATEVKAEAKARGMDEGALSARSSQILEAMKLEAAGKLTDKEAVRLGFESIEEARLLLTEIDSNPSSSAKKIAKLAAEDVAAQAAVKAVEMRLAAGAENEAYRAATPAPGPRAAPPAPEAPRLRPVPTPAPAQAQKAAAARRPRKVPAETQGVINNVINRFNEAGIKLTREQNGDIARSVLALRKGQINLGEFWRRVNEAMPASALPENMQMKRPFPSFPELGMTIQSPEALNFFVRITAEALTGVFRPEVAAGLPAEASVHMGFVSLDLRRQNLLNAIAENPQLRVIGDINIYEYFTRVVRDVGPEVNARLRAEGIDATVASTAFGTSSDEAGFFIVARDAKARERARAILGDTIEANFRFEGSVLDQMTKGTAIRPYIEEVFTKKGRVGVGAAFAEISAGDMAAIAKDPASFIDRMRRISDARIGEGDWVRAQKGAPTDADLPATALHFMGQQALGGDYHARNEALRVEFTGRLERINVEIFGPGNERVRANDSVVVVSGELVADKAGAGYATLRSLSSKKGKMSGSTEEGRIGLSVSNMPSQASGDEFLFIQRSSAAYARERFAEAHGIKPENIDIVQTGNSSDFYFRIKDRKITQQEAAELLAYYREGGKKVAAEGFEVTVRGTVLSGDGISFDGFRNSIRYLKDGVSHGDLRLPREGGLVDFNSIPRNYTDRDMRLNRAGQVMGMFFSSEGLIAKDTVLGAQLAKAAGESFVTDFRAFLEKEHIGLRSWEDMRVALERFPGGKEIARKLSSDEFLGWVGARYKDVNVGEATAAIRARMEAPPEKAKPAAPAPPAAEKEGAAKPSEAPKPPPAPRPSEAVKAPTPAPKEETPPIPLVQKPQAEAEPIPLVQRAKEEVAPSPAAKPAEVPAEAKAATERFNSLVNELSGMPPAQRQARLQQIKATDSDLALTLTFTLTVPEPMRAKLAQDYGAAMVEKARIQRVKEARAAVTPAQRSAQERELIMGTEADRAAGRIPPAIEAMAKARGQKPADFQNDLANDHTIGGIAATLERLVGLDNIQIPNVAGRPEVLEGHHRAIADLLLRGNLEGVIAGLDGMAGAKISGISHEGGLSGVYIVELQLPGGAKRRVIVKAEEPGAARFGVNMVRAQGLITSDIHQGHPYDTGVIDPATKKPVMAEYSIITDIHDYATGRETTITLADGRSVKATEGQRVKVRMPNGQMEDVQVMGAAMAVSEILNNPAAAAADPKKAAAVQEFYRLLSTPEGRKRLFDAWDAYHEYSRRALLMDRFARNTAVMLVDRGPQHPASGRYQILFQPIDTDGVGYWISSKPDGSPKFNNFNDDFARATGDLMVKLERAQAVNRPINVETAGGERKPIYEGSPLTLGGLYGEYFGPRENPARKIPPQTPPERKAVVDYVIRPQEGQPFGLGFDTTKPGAPGVGTITEHGGRPRVIARKDARGIADTAELGRVFDAAAGNGQEFAERHARRVAGLADLKLEGKRLQGNDIEVRLAARLAASEEYKKADAAGRIRIAQEELAKLSKPPAPVPPPLPGAKGPVRPPPLPAAAKAKAAPPVEFALGRAIAGPKPEEAFAQLHPAEVPGQPGFVMRDGQPVAAYHVMQHTENVARTAHDLTLARARAGDFTAADKAIFGTAEEKARFMSQVGILHDADPRRDAGAPARVPATLHWMRSAEGRAFMKAKFGWDEATPMGKARIAIAEAMIQRTEFPFDTKTKQVKTWAGDSPGAAAAIGGHYKTKSPAEHYKELLQQLEAISPVARDFVLREAPFFSEYADKSSWYFERPEAALLTVTGLTNEVKSVLPPGVPAPDFLPTTRGNFLDTIGKPANFTEDVRIARELGAPEPKIPGRDEVLGMLSEGQKKNWQATNEMFGLAEAYHKGWDKAPPTIPEERARYDALLGTDPAARDAKLATLRDMRSRSLSTEQAAREIAVGVEGTAPRKEASAAMEVSERDILGSISGEPTPARAPPPPPAGEAKAPVMPPPLPGAPAQKAPAKPPPLPPAAKAKAPAKPPPLPAAAKARVAAAPAEPELVAQAKTYADMAEPSKPLPSGWADAAMVGMIRKAMATRPGESAETVALDVVRSVNALADAATPGKAPLDSAGAKTLGYRNADEANASIALAREWAGIQGTPPDRDALLTAALAVRGMESQGRAMAFADTTGQNYANEPGSMPPNLGVKMKWGDIEFTVSVFKDRVVMESVSPKGVIGQGTWPSGSAHMAALRYMRARYQTALELAFRPVMENIPAPAAAVAAWSRAYASAKKVNVDLAKSPPPLQRRAMGAEDIVAVVRTGDAAAHPDAAAAFRAMDTKGRQEVIKGVGDLARPAERRANELIAKAGEMEIQAGRFEREGKSAEAQAARKQAQTLRESAEYSRKFAAHWREKAGYFNELNALSGPTGDHLAVRYGVKRAELETAYSASPSTAEGRMAVFKRLGITLEALPDASIRHEIYKGFTSLADDPYICGMVFTGNLFRELEALIPGGRVKSIKFQNGLVGAYQLSIEAPGGKTMLLFAKRQDLNPDRSGSAGSRLLGAPAPEIMVASGNKEGGPALRFTGPDGTETGYGIMRNMGDFAGTLLINGREVKVRSEASESFFDVALPTGNDQKRAARDTLMRDVQENPDKVLEEAGYFQTGAAIGGFYDRHELNSWTTRVAIDEPPAKAKETAEFLRKQGIDVRQEPDGRYTFMRAGGIDTDTFGSYQGVVGSWRKLEGGFTPERISELQGQGFIIRQEADLSYSWFQPGSGNDVSFVPMFRRFAEDLHRYFARMTYVMNEAELRNAKAEGRPPKILTMEQVVKRAFGENMDGPFIRGMQRRLREVDQATPQGRAFAKQMLNNVMKPFDGRPSGMGSPLSGRLRTDFESNGIAWAGGAFNGEANTPITNRDGRATFRVRYEASTNPTVTEVASKSMVRALPDNVEVRLVALDNLPPAVRKQAEAAIKAADPQAREFRTSMVRGKRYLVVKDAESIPESIGGIQLRAASISVMRSGDTVYTYNQGALAEALPQGVKRYVISAEGLGMLRTGKLVRAGGKMVTLGLGGKNRYIVFETMEAVPAAMRPRAAEVTRDQNVIRGDAGMGKKLNIDTSELGAGRMFEEMLKLGNDEWKGLWQITMDGILRQEAAEREAVFKPEPGKPPAPAGDFLVMRVPPNADRKLLPPDYGGPAAAGPKLPTPPPPPPSPTPILKPGQAARKVPPPPPPPAGQRRVPPPPPPPPPAAAVRLGPGGTRIIGPAEPAKAPLPPPPPGPAEQRIAPPPAPAAPRVGPGGTKIMAPAEERKVPPAPPPPPPVAAKKAPPPPSPTPVLNPEDLIPVTPTPPPPPPAARPGPAGTKILRPAEPEKVPAPPPPTPAPPPQEQRKAPSAPPPPAEKLGPAEPAKIPAPPPAEMPAPAGTKRGMGEAVKMPPASEAKLPGAAEAPRYAPAPPGPSEAPKMPGTGEARTAASDSLAVPAPPARAAAPDEAARGRLLEQNRAAQTLAESPSDLFALAQRVAKGETAALDALGDHPAAAAIRDFAARRAFERAVRQNDTVALKRFERHDIPALAGRIRSDAVRVMKEYSSAPKPAAKEAPGVRDKAMTPERVAGILGGADVAQKQAAVAEFTKMGLEEQGRCIAALRQGAAQERAKASEHFGANRNDEGNAALDRAETLHYQAVYLQELGVLGGAVGKAMEKQFGLQPGELTRLYGKVPNRIYARKAVADRLGIRAPDLADDHVFGMLISGNLAGVLKGMYPGATAIEMRDIGGGATGAYMVKVHDSTGVHVEFVKRVDMRADALGGINLRRSGIPAPEVIFKGDKGQLLSYTRADGASSAYGITRSIAGFDTTVRIGGRDIPLQARSAASLDRLADSPELLGIFINQPERFWEQLGYMNAASFAVGAIDGHEANSFAMIMKVRDPTSENLAALKKAGYQVETAKDGSTTVFMIGRIDTDDSGGTYWALGQKGNFDFGMFRDWIGRQHVFPRLFAQLAQVRNQHEIASAGAYRFEVPAAQVDGYRAMKWPVTESGGKFFIETYRPDQARALEGAGLPAVARPSRKPRLVTPNDMINAAFGAPGTEGSFYKGIRRWVQEHAADPQYGRLMADGFRQAEGEPIGVSSFHVGESGPRRQQLNEEGATYHPNVPYNGEENMPVFHGDGRGMMMPDYERVAGLYGPGAPAPWPQQVLDLFPHGKQVYVVPMEPGMAGMAGVFTNAGRNFAVFTPETLPPNLRSKAIGAVRLHSTLRTVPGFGEMTGLPTQRVGAVPVFDFIMGMGEKGFISEFGQIRDIAEQEFARRYPGGFAPPGFEGGAMATPRMPAAGTKPGMGGP